MEEPEKITTESLDNESNKNENKERSNEKMNGISSSGYSSFSGSSREEDDDEQLEQRDNRAVDGEDEDVRVEGKLEEDEGNIGSKSRREITSPKYRQLPLQAEVNGDEPSNETMLEVEKKHQRLQQQKQHHHQPELGSSSNNTHNIHNKSHHLYNNFQDEDHNDLNESHNLHADEAVASGVRIGEQDDYKDQENEEQTQIMTRREGKNLMNEESQEPQESLEEQEQRELQEYAEKIRQRIGRRRSDQDSQHLFLQKQQNKRRDQVNQDEVTSFFVPPEREEETVQVGWERNLNDFEEECSKQTSFLLRRRSLPSPSSEPPSSSLPPTHHTTSSSGRISLLVHPSRIQEENQGDVELEEAQESSQTISQFNQTVIQHEMNEGNHRLPSSSSTRVTNSCSSPLPPALPPHQTIHQSQVKLRDHHLSNQLQRQDSSGSSYSPSVFRRQQLTESATSSPRQVHVSIQAENNRMKEPETMTIDSSTKNETPLNNANDSTMKKGLLWQMKDGSFFFNRWKERYFILTQDYLTCFKKKASLSRRKKRMMLGSMALSSFMGSYSYKLKLLDIQDISWKCCSDCSSSGRSRSSVARRFLLPRSMTMVAKSKDNNDHKNIKKMAKRSKSSDPANSSQQHSQSHSLSLGASDVESGIEVIEHRSYSMSGETGVSLSDATSSRSSSRRSKSTFRGNGREVISITILTTDGKKGSKSQQQRSQIDLWTDCESELNEWMFILKQAVDHSKGRREAFIKKSQTLCIPDASSQPFALSSYWASSR